MVMIIFTLIFSTCNSNHIDKIKKSDSVYVSYYNNGMINEIVTINKGLIYGNWIKYYNTGEKHYESTILNGAIDGKLIQYRKNGNIYSIESYKNGEKNGEAKYYNELGNCVIEEGNYDNNKQTGVWYYYKNHKIYSILLYKDDTINKIIFKNKDIADSLNIPPPPP